MNEETDNRKPEAERQFAPVSLLGDLPREQQVLISTLGSIEHLIDLGMLTGPKLMTDKGKQILAELKATGFKPTPEETQWAMSAITSKSPNEKAHLPPGGGGGAQKEQSK